MSRKRTHEDVTSEDEKVFVYYEHTELSSIPKGITSLRIDKSVRKIPANAFQEQYELAAVEYEEGLEVIGDKAFFYCTELKDQQFPSTLVEIGNRAFSFCRILESLKLPPSLKIIRESAFSQCFSLESIEMHDGILLENYVFSYCRKLTHFRLPREMVAVPQFLLSGCSSLVNVYVPDSVIDIGQGAFACCEKLAMIELPAGLKTIGKDAFCATAITNFRCPAEAESIGEGALRCRSLESVTLPPKLESISQCLFDNCFKLKDISIPQSVVRLGIRAFGKSGLTQLDLSRCNITSIGRYAFASCSSLKDVILPKTNLKRIEERTFEKCECLTNLWIPPTVEYIENGAFDGCLSLLSVEVPETLKSLVFIGKYRSLVNIYIPRLHQLDEVGDLDFARGMKLAKAESNYEELVGKLKCRFDSLPLHRACYFQSYNSLQENITKIRSIITADPGACDRIDFLGMTPFHILALSSRPWLKLFQELFSVSSLDILKCRDIFGKTPLDYLCRSSSLQTECVTKSLLLNLIETRVSFLGVDWWKRSVLVRLGEMQMACNLSRNSKAMSVCKELERFEWREVLSLLEMSVWRMKVQGERATGKVSRESCRINCGGSIVLEHVIPFLKSEQPDDDRDGNSFVEYSHDFGSDFDDEFDEDEFDDELVDPDEENDDDRSSVEIYYDEDEENNDDDDEEEEDNDDGDY